MIIINIDCSLAGFLSVYTLQNDNISVLSVNGNGAIGKYYHCQSTRVIPSHNQLGPQLGYQRYPTNLKLAYLIRLETTSQRVIYSIHHQLFYHYICLL